LNALNQCHMMCHVRLQCCVHALRALATIPCSRLFSCQLGFQPMCLTLASCTYCLQRQPLQRVQQQQRHPPHAQRNLVSTQTTKSCRAQQCRDNLHFKVVTDRISSSNSSDSNSRQTFNMQAQQAATFKTLAGLHMPRMMYCTAGTICAQVDPLCCP
jgi:hypothetical protein